REAESEDEQMKRMAVLFDLNKMTDELQSDFEKLKDKQLYNGGFPWFDGGTANYNITSYIVSGFGHLKAMGVDLDAQLGPDYKQVLESAVAYLDKEAGEQYDRHLKDKRSKVNNYGAIQYLYAR